MGELKEDGPILNLPKKRCDQEKPCECCQNGLAEA